MNLHQISTALRCPSLIHRVDDLLREVPQDSILGLQIASGMALNRPRMVIADLTQQMADNREGVERVIGRKLMELIDEYNGL